MRLRFAESAMRGVIGQQALQCNAVHAAVHGMKPRGAPRRRQGECFVEQGRKSGPIAGFDVHGACRQERAAARQPDSAFSSMPNTTTYAPCPNRGARCVRSNPKRRQGRFRSGRQTSASPPPAPNTANANSPRPWKSCRCAYRPTRPRYSLHCSEPSGAGKQRWLRSPRWPPIKSRANKDALPRQRRTMQLLAGSRR